MADLEREQLRAPNAGSGEQLEHKPVVGRHEGEWRNAGWYIPHRIVTDAEGPNDGVVSITSATYGESTAVWDGDHLSLVNWPHPRGLWEDRAAHYGALVQRLADEGF